MTRQLFMHRQSMVYPGRPAAENPLFSNVQHLYSFTAITSQSEEINGLTIYNNGCSVSTSNKHFGNNTTLFNSTDFVGNDGSAAQRARMRFDAAGDFVMEAWVWHTGAFTVNRMIAAIYKTSVDSRNWQLRILGDDHSTDPGKLRWTGFTDGGSGASGYSVDGPIVPQNRWVHWAVQRKGTLHKVYVDGIPGNGHATSSRPSGAGTDTIRWGLDNDGNFQFAGYMSDFRVTIGESLYPDSGFTPPTAIWPRS